MEKITRSELEMIDPRKRMALMLNRDILLVDDPPQPPQERPPGSILRTSFDSMSDQEKWDTVMVKKQKIVD